MANRTFHYSLYVMKFLEKILGTNFTVSGLENIPQKPVLFVANHFTRSETFIIPYLIYKYKKRQVRSLADSALFGGRLGRFLESAGTISTKDLNRNKKIIRDLITGQYDWIIYPEGSMIKSKQIEKTSRFINYTPSRVGPARTGSAVLALKSEILRGEIIDAQIKKDHEFLKEIDKEFNEISHLNLSDLNTNIVPVNISYYPIRPGRNGIQKIITSFVKNLPKAIAEELEIEGNLLFNSQMNVEFCKPINITEYIGIKRTIINAIPIIKTQTKRNLLIKYFRVPLTVHFMREIYSNCLINFDHIFAATIYHIKEKHVSIDHLKRIIYLSCTMIASSKKYYIHQSVEEENIFKLFIDEKHDAFDGVFNLAIKQKIIKKISDEVIEINRSAFDKKYDFHEIRLENILKVVINEFLLLKTPNDIVKRNVAISDDLLKQKVFDEIFNSDLEKFERDYKNTYDENFSKDKEVGLPFYLPAKKEQKIADKNLSVLISHGYKSSPKEVEPLAKYLNNLGYNVYAVRLKGHGTTALDLSRIKWQEWYDSLQRGYGALRNISDKISIIGFSTGGLLTLLSSANKNENSKSFLNSIISINSALRLRDIRARFVPGINAWNQLMKHLKIKRGRLEYIEDLPENIVTNYKRNYLTSIEQLGDLMEECENNLKKVTQNSLLIQAINDPVVNSSGAKIIFKKIKSKNKILKEVDFSNHVIINGDRKEEIFKIISDYLEKKFYN